MANTISSSRQTHVKSCSNDLLVASEVLATSTSTIHVMRLRIFSISHTCYGKYASKKEREIRNKVDGRNHAFSASFVNMDRKTN
ncbi:pyridoxal 5-phosphate synthase glutaminase subunit PdxT [Sesbania bispinosa]|nr:pyridoxal 5-phosphate synthase glutaminase subunit PdxT [Sesbania bispinosa]